MPVFVNILLVVFLIQNVKSDFKFCDNDNVCNINESFSNDSETSNLSTLVKHAIKYFNDLSQKYDQRISSISKDIDHIKSSLQAKIVQVANCTNSTEQLSSVQESQATSERPPSLYDNLWIVIQRRQQGSIDFHRTWYHYRQGFGNLFREFFIGLEKLYYLTNMGPQELIIHLRDFKGNIKYALYDEFLVGSESEKYQLKKLGNYSGTAGDYLRNNEGMFFSTKDKDNDASDSHCARRFEGGWWYNNCTTSNLNGPYRRRYETNRIGINWGKYDDTPIQVVQMMIRLKR